MTEDAASAHDDITAVRESIARRLEKAGSVVLTTHVTPDGDGLGSAIALCRHLRRRGKEAMVINCSSVPHDLRWLYERGEFQVYNGARHEKRVLEADAIVATDIGGSERLGKMLDPIRRSEGTKIVIDHHVYDNDLFDLPLITTEVSSSAEITYDLLRHMGARVDRHLAVPLYVGLVSDTGGFAYSATSPQAHRMAAELLSAGVDPHAVWQATHCQIPHGKMHFLGLLMTRLKLEHDGRLVWTSVDLEFLRSHDTVPRDAFEIVNYFLRIKGVEVGAFFMEITQTRTKVSLRSSGAVDVCRVAKRHGGGGHKFAAGCAIDAMGLAAAIPHVIEDIGQQLPPLEAEE